MVFLKLVWLWRTIQTAFSLLQEHVMHGVMFSMLMLVVGAI